jgi:hypothetical protein
MSSNNSLSALSFFVFSSICMRSLCAAEHFFFPCVLTLVADFVRHKFHGSINQI